MIDGTKIQLNGTEYVVPALNLNQVQMLRDDVALLNTVDSSDPFSKDRHEAACRIVHAALSRNYPELKLEEMGELMDLRNFSDLYRTVMGASGLVQAEAEKPGEA